MENKYWLNKWRSKDIAFHEQNINPDLMAYIHTLNLQPGNCILVPLCGKTKDMLWLAKEGFKVIGVELSPIACQEFFTEMDVSPEITKHKEFTSYKHNDIELLCGDILNLTSTDLPTIHAIYDCKALIALPPETRKKYANHLISCLGTNIKILLLVIEGDGNLVPPPYSVDKIEVNLLYGSYFKIKQLKCTPLNNIPGHLIKKGYLNVRESAYFLSKKK